MAPSAGVCLFLGPFMAHMTHAKGAIPLKLVYMCWPKNVSFAMTLDGPQGHLGRCWLIIW